jgi:hypothetical protein
MATIRYKMGHFSECNGISRLLQQHLLPQETPRQSAIRKTEVTLVVTSRIVATVPNGG